MDIYCRFRNEGPEDPVLIGNHSSRKSSGSSKEVVIMTGF